MRNFICVPLLLVTVADLATPPTPFRLIVRFVIPVKPVPVIVTSVPAAADGGLTLVAIAASPAVTVNGTDFVPAGPSTVNVYAPGGMSFGSVAVPPAPGSLAKVLGGRVQHERV